MLRVIVVLVLTPALHAQFFGGSSNARSLGGKQPCSSTVTTNCVPNTDASGNVAIGTRLPDHTGAGVYSSPTDGLETNKLNGKALGDWSACADATVLTYVAATSTWGCAAASNTPNVVLGNANLTTAGRIPFVSAAGTVTEDSNLFWDNTNKRLGLRIAAPSATLEVTQKADAATDTVFLVRATDVGSPSGAVMMGMNAAKTDELWRFAADGSFITVDEAGDDLINLVRQADAVWLQITRDGANENAIIINQGAATKLVMDSDGDLDMTGKLTFSADTTIERLAANILGLATGSGDKVSVGVLNATTATESLNVLGNIRGQNVVTDDTIKTTRWVVGHYSNEEEAFMGMLVQSISDASNRVQIGGGSSSYNAATTIEFYTAANGTTLTGTERMSISSAGVVKINGLSGAGVQYVCADASGNLTRSAAACGS